jgi:hypothetical protein
MTLSGCAPSLTLRPASDDDDEDDDEDDDDDDDATLGRAITSPLPSAWWMKERESTARTLSDVEMSPLTDSTKASAPLDPRTPDPGGGTPRREHMSSFGLRTPKSLSPTEEIVRTLATPDACEAARTHEMSLPGFARGSLNIL